jgi:hypothetical protein
MLNDDGTYVVLSENTAKTKKVKQTSSSTTPSETQPDQKTKTKRCPKGTKKNKVNA